MDQAIKDLLTEFPLDAWRFLLPDLAERLGDPVAWEPIRSEARKYDLRKKGWVMDLPIRFSFPSGEALVVVVLIEHWATSGSVNLHRTARYVLDLMERFPDQAVVPVALVTDLKPGPVAERLRLEDLVDAEPVLTFRHRVQLVAHHDLTIWNDKTNVIAAALTVAMSGDMSHFDKARLGLLRLEDILNTEQMLKIAQLVFRVGKLDEEEQEDIMAAKSTLPEPKIFKMLRAEGKAEFSKETARKLLEHGISWEIITSSTGIKPTDLK